jgi:translation initiation factor 2-alpha kinase 4
MRSMLEAHSHLQQLNIAHRDVKPENILLFDQEELLFKICDVNKQKIFIIGWCGY